VDAETGKVKVVRYLAVDDCGEPINPMLIDGQVHGGIVHAIGQALYEQIVYDEDGQLVTGTFVDYALPTAAEVPSFETDRTVTPSPVNSLGVKGIGEAGTIAATPAVAAAVLDAIEPHGDGPRATEQGRPVGEHGQGSAGSGPASPDEGGAA
jgi:carbon-monoxide dehydrogenase large subunit